MPEKNKNKKGRVREKTAQSKPKSTAPENAGGSWGRGKTRLALGIILFLSTALGVASVLLYMQSPCFNVPVVDERGYVSWAQRIAAGQFMGRGAFYQDPLYPYFLSLVFMLFGKNLLLVRLAQVLMGTASVALVFWTAKKLMGDLPGLLAAAIMAACRGLYFFELQILKAGMVIFLSAASCALGVWAAARPGSWRRWVLVGASAGLLALLRGNFQAIIPLVILWALMFSWKDGMKQRLLRPALVGAGVALIVLPVTIRNYAASGEFVLTTSQGGANFYLGNNELADGRYTKLPFVRANPMFDASDFKSEAERRTGAMLSSSQVSSYWFGQGLDWIAENPAKAARLWLKKSWMMIHQCEISDNHSFNLVRSLFVPSLWLAVIGFGMLWGPAVVGGAVLAASDRRAWYPALFAVAYAASIIPFFIVARYRLAVVPAMAVFFSAALFRLAGWWREKNYRLLGVAAAFVLASLAAGFWPMAECRDALASEYQKYGNASLDLGDPNRALAWYGLALENVAPGDQDLRKKIMELQSDAALISGLLVEEMHFTRAKEFYRAGVRFEQLGYMDYAVREYQKAISIKPDYFEALGAAGYLHCGTEDAFDPDAGLILLERARALRPDSLDAMSALALCRLQKGDETGARGLWEAVIRIDPSYESARRNLEKLGAR